MAFSESRRVKRTAKPPSLQSCLTRLAALAQCLPPGYHISIRMLRHGYAMEVIDPDGTSLAEVATPRLFVELILMAQMDALRRASDGIQ